MAFADLFKINEMRETISRLEQERNKLFRENRELSDLIASKTREFEKTVANLKSENKKEVTQLKATISEKEECAFSLQSHVEKLQQEMETLRFYSPLLRILVARL